MPVWRCWPGLRACTPADADLATFYASGDRRWVLLSGLYVLPLAAVAFLWFVAALRQWVEMSSRTIDHLLATVQMLSGVAFITLAFAAAGAVTIVANSVELANLPVDPTIARQFPLYSRTLLIIFGMRMAAIFVTTTAKLGHEAQLFPTVVRLWQLWRGRGALSGGNPQCLAGGRLPALGAGAQWDHLVPRTDQRAGAGGLCITSLTRNRAPTPNPN